MLNYRGQYKFIAEKQQFNLVLVSSPTYAREYVTYTDYNLLVNTWTFNPCKWDMLCIF